uniref:Uncharacterized protein n=1 Tax=Eutreptiella gymnastica TaxID=73025 RepID=A0A7S4CDG9_9EUGL
MHDAPCVFTSSLYPSPWETVGQLSPRRCLGAGHQPHTHATTAPILRSNRQWAQKTGKQGPPSVVWTRPCWHRGADDIEAPSVSGEMSPKVRKGIVFRERHPDSSNAHRL